MNLHHCPSCGCQLKGFEPITLGNVSIDGLGQIVFEGAILTLPPTQHILVDALVRARGRGLTRATLANLIGPDLNDSSIPKYVERLRDSFRQTDPNFDQIECLRGFGAYRWNMRRKVDSIENLPSAKLTLFQAA